MITLSKTRMDGVSGYRWDDENGKTWFFYHSVAVKGWVYRRRDHLVSSVKFATLAAAVADLKTYFA